MEYKTKLVITDYLQSMQQQKPLKIFYLLVQQLFLPFQVSLLAVQRQQQQKNQC